MEKYYHYQA